MNPLVLFGAILGTTFCVCGLGAFAWEYRGEVAAFIKRYRQLLVILILLALALYFTTDAVTNP